MDEYFTRLFAISNPEGEGQDSVSALLRRLADALDEMGDIDVSEITFGNDVTEDGDFPFATVYFTRPEDVPPEE